MEPKFLGLVWWADKWKYFTGFKDTGKNKTVKIAVQYGYDNVKFPLYKIEINHRWHEVTSDRIKRLPMGATLRIIKEGE